jgi:hypothetical protein
VSCEPSPENEDALTVPEDTNDEAVIIPEVKNAAAVTIPEVLILIFVPPTPAPP